MRRPKNIAELDSIIKNAFKGFAGGIRSDPRWHREHELVSLFVFGHLIPKAQSSGVLIDPTQIGIGAAVPQLKRLWTRRRRSDVCKDIVIWPEPGMTCWDADGEPEYFPLSILEWKSLNRQDRGLSLSKKRQEKYAEDFKWLCDMSRWTMRKNRHFVGYRVFVNQKTTPIQITVDRAFRGTPEKNWWSR